MVSANRDRVKNRIGALRLDRPAEVVDYRTESDGWTQVPESWRVRKSEAAASGADLVSMECGGLDLPFSFGGQRQG